ncbi:YchJ family protein [Cellulomonas soli]
MSAPVRPGAADPCPCGSGDLWAACCGPVLDGARPAPTAEALMRSRYSAFAVGDPAHLLATWHPSTRPPRLDLDDDVEWRRLTVLAATGGGPWDETGTVEFVAAYRTADGRGRLHEHSRFVREGGRWFYVDGDVRA